MTTSVIFVVCECVQRVTNSYSALTDTINQFDWYLYPIEIQHLLVPIIMYAQKPVEIAFFGSITCNREQFSKVSLFLCYCAIFSF